MSTATATVLFTDLVGSTDLSVRHGPRFDAARRSHDSLLRAAVEAHGGRVIKGLGDGIMATFAAVADGIAAARAAQQSIHRLNRQGCDPALSIRVGLAVGDVSFEDADCFGEAVIVAARLCAIAEADQILTTDLLRALAGSTPVAGSFEDLGAFELKGLPRAVSVVAVCWDRLARSTAPLPSRLAVRESAFVGRLEEIAELTRHYEHVLRSGQRRVVLVGGEPGLGKTSVVAEAARSWHESGATVVMGWCDEDVGAPYQPFIEALSQLVQHAPTEVLHAHVARHGASLVSLVPGLVDRLDRLPERVVTDPETERFLLFSAAADLLAACGEHAPVVVFLDDLHWADSGSASLLRSLGSLNDPARLLIVGTFRDDEVSGDHPMGKTLAAFHRVPSVSRLHLGGLRSEDVVELLAQWVGGVAPSQATGLAARLVAETDGNAFFVTEVVRYLHERGQLDDPRGSAPWAAMPESIREVLAERVATLGPMADEILSAAAVAGTEFGPPLLAAVTGVAEDKVLRILGDAAAAALVREVWDDPGRFRFSHALVQHAILANLGPTREAGLHLRVAEELEARRGAPPPAAELAHHWLQATRSSDGRRSLDWARQAGDDAMAALAPDDAVSYYRQALLLHDQLRLDEPTTRIDLLIRLGTAERQSGDPEHRDTLLKAARLAQRAGDADRLAAAALANNSGTFSVFGGVDGERVAMLEAAIESTVDDGQRALLLSTLANELTYSGDFARRRALVDRALTDARATADAGLLLRVLNLVFYPLWVPDTLEERLALTDESLELLPLVDDPLALYWSAVSSHTNLTQAGRVEESDVFLARLRELAERLAQPALLWRARHIHATRELLRGDPDAAEPLAREALELGASAGERAAGVYHRSQEACLHWQRGTMTELSARIKGTSPRAANAAALLCLIFAEGGRADEAATVLADQAAAGIEGLPRDPAYIASLAYFSETAILVGDEGAAARLHPLLLPYASQVGFDGVTTVGSLDHYLGGLATVLGRLDEAVERLGRSIALHASIEAPFFEARGRHQRAVALLARGQPGDAAGARGELEQAALLAERHGYRTVQRRAAELLLSMGGG